MEDASTGISNGTKTPAASIDTLLVTAEAINREGSKLYRQGNFEAAAARYSEALKRLDGSADFHDANKAGERSRQRSKYYANRAQARMQLHDFEMAAVDYRASINEDPRNAKALIWWGRCEEALGHWDEALKRFESASALLRPGNNLLRIALEGGRRARANRDTDRKVAHAESIPQELVHRGQMLRLSFREPVPTECCLGEWFSLSLGLSNEFGLWRRNDFGQTTSPEEDAGDDGRTSSSSPRGLPISEAAGEWGRGAGTENEAPTASGRLRLVVEARDLEGFGGRSLATQPLGSQRGTENGASIKVPNVSSPPLVELPRSRGGIMAASVRHRASSLPAFDEGRYLAVETESNEGGNLSDIGPEGKTALRARFVAVSKSCSNRLNGDGDNVKTKASSVIRPSFVARLPVSNQPRLVLLRVSVLEDDARSLLGRCVVPVLSLPIAVHEAKEGTGTYRKDPTTANALPTTAVENGAPLAVAEQTTLAVDASKAGAIGCREAIVPVARSLTFSSVISRWRRERPDRSCGVASVLSSAASASGCNGNNGDSLGYYDGCDRGHASGEVVVLVAESPGQLGIGGKVWDSAFVLCDYLATTPASAADASAAITAPVVTVAAASPPSEIPDRGTCANGGRATSRGHGALEVTTGALTFPQASGMVRSLPSGVEDVSANRSVATSEPPVEHTLGVDEAGATNTAAAHWPSFMGSLVQGKRVLELGAGTGLVSICCSLLGATAVVATDFEGVTELIKVNVALNFSEASSQPPSTSVENGLPSVLTSTELHRRGQRAYSAGEKPPDLVNHTLCAGREAKNGGGSGGSGDSSLSWKSRQELVERSEAPVVAVPLVWGERSAVVEAFDPEMVVMSDVVYDPAGYEPLLQTLLEIMRPKVIAVMAHRHRHPEDYVFFERLCQLFHVVEEKGLPQGGCAQQKHTPPALKAEAGERRFEGADVRIFRIWHRASP